jgi:hypothetical protein
MDDKSGTIFGFSLADLDTFVWGLGPAALGLILIYVAEKVLAPKRALASSELEPRLARAYSFAWYAALGFFAVFVGVWVAVMFAAERKAAWALIRSVPPRYSILAETVDELYIKTIPSFQANFGATYKWVSFDHRSIHLQFIRKGTDGDEFYTVHIPMDGEQFKRALNKSFELRFIERQGTDPAKLVDMAHPYNGQTPKEYPLVSQRYASRNEPRYDRGLALVSSAHAEDRVPFDVARVKEALLSQSISIRRAAIGELVKELARTEVKDFVNAELGNERSDKNVRLGITTALALAVRGSRLADPRSYFQVPAAQPALSFLQPFAIGQVVRDSLDASTPVGSQARTLLLSMYDQRVRDAFKRTNGVAGSTQASCRNLVELNIYYNWLVSLAGHFRDGAPATGGQPAVPKGKLVEAHFLDQIGMLAAWMDEARSALTGEQDVANGLLAEYGRGVGYAELGLLGSERFAAAAIASARQSPQALVATATAAFREFAAKAKTLPNFRAHYRFPWHINVAKRFIATPTMDSIDSDEDDRRPISGPPSCPIGL